MTNINCSASRGGLRIHHVLEAWILKAVAKKPLPAKPTVRDALLAVAALGGHIKNNG